jgi:hypothetical protein
MPTAACDRPAEARDKADIWFLLFKGSALMVEPVFRLS